MQEPNTPKAGETLARTERLIILQVAGTRGRSRDQLIRVLSGVGKKRVEEAIASLAGVGVVVVVGRSVRQSSALERIDWLGFIEV